MIVEVVTALLRAIDGVLKQDNLDPNGRLYFSVSSNGLPNVYTGDGLRARDWKEGNDRVDGVLGDLAKHLNSQKQFGLDDSFQLYLTQVLDACTAWIPTTILSLWTKKPSHFLPSKTEHLEEK